ncbi:hypothetical protein K470DRAFT_259779 [Piedraia hortae CBS 480.64]|uniref:Uncharacterized protein n=1 Tax=Piedraia hortae CBS 480.64 TaxID=1314780 RepID=A0A6A7BTL5_9PEZI|nr:hypothetical protein K470DRAFT_259779 [Piedraia hortae CBS 480.64]
MGLLEHANTQAPARAVEAFPLPAPAPTIPQMLNAVSTRLVQILRQVTGETAVSHRMAVQEGTLSLAAAQDQVTSNAVFIK